MGFIIWLIIGGLAGVVAGKLMSGHGFGIIVDVILGVVGGLLGGWLASLLLGVDPMNISNLTGLIVSFVVSVVGACIIVAIVHLIKREPVRS